MVDDATPRGRDHVAGDSALPSDDAGAPRGGSTAAEAILETIGRLRWLTLLLPVLIVATVELGHLVAGPVLSPGVAALVAFALALVAAALYYQHAFDRIEEVQERFVQQNRELLALHEASVSITAELSLESVLQKVVDLARDLLDTHYGALSVMEDSGRIRSFVTTGVDPATEEAIGDPPKGRGVLGIVLREGQRLRLDHISKHSRSVGFPSGHPEMRTLLAVPVVCNGPYRGNLYLSERRDGFPFTEEDEETLVRFADQAAVAIDNAHLHHQVREMAAARERIHMAHEMHDGIAQVLAFVNTKSQVVQEYCRRKELEAAEAHLEELREAAKEVYEDVRAQILDLRTTAPTEKSLAHALTEYLTKWRQHTDLHVDLELPEDLDLDPDVEIQVLRIIQEALTNVRKHAEATRVGVELQRLDGRFLVTIRDDGKGFQPGRSRPGRNPRFGLSTMRERASALGADLEIQSTPGGGTTITLDLPLPHSTN